jgi:hypothetical protein
MRYFFALSCLAALSALLVSCGKKEQLPPPGAERLVVMHWWDESGGPPAYMQAQRLKQDGAVFQKLEFYEVMTRLPSQGGVAYITAPRAYYERGASEEIILSAVENTPSDGSVRLVGSWQGDLFMGRADKAVFEESTRRMRLDNVELIYQGLRQSTKFIALTEDRMIPFGTLQRLADSPALSAALAALPANMQFPPMRGK